MSFADDINAELSQITSPIYDGAVSKGLKHGVGRCVLPNGDAFKGTWKNGLRHGPGICRFANGVIFKGEWRDDIPHGLGILFTPGPNELIEARFEDWKVVNGQVRILFSNGEFYDGIFEEGTRHTRGTHYYLNGDHYVGSWHRDQRVKQSKIYQANGHVLTATFTNDVADGYVTFEDRHGNTFQSMEDDVKAKYEKNDKKNKLLSNRSQIK